MMLISWATRIAEPPKTGLEFWKTLFLVYLDLDFRALENGFVWKHMANFPNSTCYWILVFFRITTPATMRVQLSVSSTTNIVSLPRKNL
ncbi:hypothetical protein CUMW_237710 [Citrus unshiu]|nr:hypothetical protein CUMW_237710 [Citrus unshiu]